MTFDMFVRAYWEDPQGRSGSACAVGTLVSDVRPGRKAVKTCTRRGVKKTSSLIALMSGHGAMRDKSAALVSSAPRGRIRPRASDIRSDAV